MIWDFSPVHYKIGTYERDDPLPKFNIIEWEIGPYIPIQR